MSDASTVVRQHLIRALDWKEAHADFAAATADLAPDRRGLRPPGGAHSPWMLVEHLRIALEDILDFCVNPQYAHRLSWPADYWPTSEAPASEAAWDDSVAAYTRALEGLARLAREVDDLTAKVPTGKPQHTYLRALLLAIDHNAYHVGQLVTVRQTLGAWHR